MEKSWKWITSLNKMKTNKLKREANYRNYKINSNVSDNSWCKCNNSKEVNNPFNNNELHNYIIIIIQMTCHPFHSKSSLSHLNPCYYSINHFKSIVKILILLSFYSLLLFLLLSSSLLSLLSHSPSFVLPLLV